MARRKSLSSIVKRAVKQAVKPKGKSLKLNWGLIGAIALLFSVYLIVTLFNGKDYSGWQEGLEELWGNFTAIGDGLKEDSRPVMAVNGEVEVHFIDVGQGDSILITGNGQAILIDAGENDKGDEVVAYLEKCGVKHLDLAIGTHPHSDHIGGLDVVIDNISTDQLWMPEIPEKIMPTTRTFNDLLDAVENNNVSALTAVPGDRAELCGGLLEVLGPVKEYDDLNDISLVTKFTFGGNSFLFTGDMESGAEADLLESGAKVAADVLKMGHHGSSTSSSKAFVDAVNPDIFAIQLGEGNSYGHPHRETLALLKERKAKVWRNDLNGSIVMRSDGSSIVVSTERGGES
ncbi:MAG: MBL fold metallo-hydrolase [Oscillospiraceae bacterium]|jgi:competence protein ComEC|nr:MBL fold metallo-hydrolase [Oscillospiraceae bacterium]